MLYLSDPTSTPVSCGSDSLEYFDVKWFLCACKLCPEIQPQIRRVLTRPHSLPSVLQPAVPGHDHIQLTLLHEVWLSSHLFFSLRIKRSPSFGPGSKTRRVRPVFVLCHSKIPPSFIIFPEVVTAGFAICMGGSSDCGDICIAWDLQCLNASEMCLGTFISSIEVLYINILQRIWVIDWVS